MTNRHLNPVRNRRRQHGPRPFHTADQAMAFIRRYDDGREHCSLYACICNAHRGAGRDRRKHRYITDAVRILRSAGHNVGPEWNP